MKVSEILSLPRDKVDQFLSLIPFYRDVKQAEQWQYDVLLQHSRVVDFEPGEIVIKRGEIDTWMYYVLKGNLIVYPGDPGNLGDKINEITPGELFGDLALLVDGKRMATIVADENAKEIQLFGTNFSILNPLMDTTLVSLKTKLFFYRHMVHSIRWKLEQYKMQHPTHHLVDEMRKVKLYLGPKDCEEELQAHYDAAKLLVGVLSGWNKEFGATSEVPVNKEFDPAAIGEIELE